MNVLRRIGIKNILIILMIIMCFLLSNYSYAALILCYIGIYSIATTGLDIVWGQAGQISYGHAGFYAIGAYTTAILSKNFGITPIIGILVGAIIATVFGIVIAFCASKLVKHFLALLTMSFGQVVYTFVNSAKNITGGSSGIKQIPNISIFSFVFDTNKKMFILILTLLLLLICIKKNVANSRIGFAFSAIKENQIAANGVGINPVKYKVIAFSMSAFYVGIAGGLYACLIHYISPETFQSSQSIIFITILLFGGIGSTLGPIIGSTIIVFIKEVFQLFSQYQQLFYAIFILIVLFFLPNGLVSLFKSFEEKIRKEKNTNVRIG